MIRELLTVAGHGSPIDYGLILIKTEYTWRRIARLWLRRHRPNFNETETTVAKSNHCFGMLIEASCYAHRINEITIK